ncbi:MAG TPA: YncE family protein, partial [Methylomirabilota bacterium]|nr:YncE family protein [Methylomirabilota bacterium]
MTRRRATLLPVRTSLLLPLLLVGLALPSSAEAQLAVSSNDNKVTLDNGVVKVVPNPAPDTATIIDLGATPPRVVAEISVPGSVVGPPLSVAIAPDQSLALI